MTKYDRTVEDLGNIVSLEHVNTRIPDQQLATIFYASGLGLTRDPYLMTGVTNMWINVGRSQFHLPGGKAEVLRGHTGLVIPNRQALVRRLEAVKKPLEGTRFSYKEHNDFVEATCPWGNRVRCFEPGERFGRMMLGMPYVELNVARGTSSGIARFYREIMQTSAGTGEDGEGQFARIGVGPGQSLIFRETAAAQPDYDGHHIAVYLADFSGPYTKLLERGLVTEESDQHQYRFLDIVDLDSNKALFHDRARSSQHATPALRAPASQPQPGPEQPQFCAGARASELVAPLDA